MPAPVPIALPDGRSLGKSEREIAARNWSPRGLREEHGPGEQSEEGTGSGRAPGGPARWVSALGGGAPWARGASWSEPVRLFPPPGVPGPVSGALAGGGGAGRSAGAALN